MREGEPIGVTIDGTPIGLYRVAARCYAVHDICTHEYAHLSNGYQDGDSVECPLHGARFDVVTGKCLMPPAAKDLATYVLKVEDGDIFVSVPRAE